MVSLKIEVEINKQFEINNKTCLLKLDQNID